MQTYHHNVINNLVNVLCCILETQVLSDVRKIMCQPDYTPTDPMELCNRLLVTCYMATENSSQETKQRASQVGVR